MIKFLHEARSHPQTLVKMLLCLALAMFLLPWPSASARVVDLSYYITATLDDQGRSLQAHQLLVVGNWAHLPLNRLYFHLFPNAFRAVETADLVRLSADLDAFEDPLRVFPRGQDVGHIEIQSVLVDGQPADYLVRGTWMTVFLPEPLCPRAKSEVEIEFRTKIPRFNSYFGCWKKIYTMAMWYPQLAFLTADGWLYEQEVHIQESLANFADYRVQLRLPGDMVVAATGSLEQAVQAGKDVYVQTWSAHHVRCFGWVGSAEFHVFTTTTQDVTVSSLFLPQHRREGSLVGAYARQALVFFGARLGKYPGQQYAVVETYLPMGGFSLPGLCVLSCSLYQLGDRSDLLESTVAHEVAHQWWGEKVDAREPWFCEGLARFWEWAYMRAHRGGEGRLLKGRLIPGPISDVSLSWLTRSMYLNLARLELEDCMGSLYSKFRESLSYQGAVYAKAPLVLEMLSQLLGKGGFLLFCRKLLSLPDHSVVTTESITNLATEVAGSDMSWFFRQWLEFIRRCDYAVVQMRCRPVGRGYLTRLRLKRRGSIIMPVEVSLSLHDGSRLRRRWDGRSNQHEVIFTSHSPAQEASVATGLQVLDVRPANNYYPRKKLLKFTLWPTPNVEPEMKIWQMRPCLCVSSKQDVHIGLGLTSGDMVLMWAPFLFQRESGLTGEVGLKHPGNRCSGKMGAITRAPFLGPRAHVEFGCSQGEGKRSVGASVRWVRGRYLCRTPYQIIKLFGRYRKIRNARNDFSLGLQLLWDRRRTVFFPTFGDLYLMSWEEGLAASRGGLAYHRLSLETWHHRLFWGSLRSSLRLFAGLLKGTADREARFDLRRDGHLYGLEADSDGGHGCLALGQELRWPLRGYVALAVADKMGFLWTEGGSRQGIGEMAVGLRFLGNSPWAIHIDLPTITRGFQKKDSSWRLGWNFRMGSEPKGI